ncbi:YgaP-like transmembrane domain [Aeromonas jandaei]
MTTPFCGQLSGEYHLHTAGVMSAILSMTGLMGFCPMCAMVGRKLDKRN